MKVALDSADRARLRRFLTDRFSLNELKDLAFDLGVNYQLFYHETLSDFSRELISYFERRNQLSCLVTEVLKYRPDENLVQLLAWLPACSPSKKIQIMVSEDLFADVSDLIGELAAKLDLPKEEIVLVGMASGSVRLLMSLPERFADLRILSQIHPDDGKRDDLSIVLFSSLDQVRQKAWRLIACVHPPTHHGSVLRPTFSWQAALEVVRRTQPHDAETASESSHVLRWQTASTPLRTESLVTSGKQLVLAWLAVLDGPHMGIVFRLDQDVITIGRDEASCNIVLDDTTVSFQHARIRVDDRDRDHVEYVLTDLASTNGTLVNGNPVQQAKLSDGDRIALGKTVFVFKCA